MLSLQRISFFLFSSVFCCAIGLFCAGCGSRNPNLQNTLPQNAPSSSDAQGKEKFVDITQASGIHYQWSISGKRPLNLLQTIGNGCALLDYDDDGNLDILLVGPRLALYQGDGKTHFRDVTHEANLDKLAGQFLGCATGDYDNDGYPDLYISGYRTGLLLHNEKGVRYRDVTMQAGLKSQPWGTSCTFGDIDNDGLLDLYVGNYVKFSPDTNPQLCTRADHLTACGPLSYEPELGVLYRNSGNGKFEDVTRFWGADKTAGKALGAAFLSDASTKGLALAIANDVMPGDLLVRTGKRFANEGSASGMGHTLEGKTYGGMGVDWGDYNNDGKFDLAVATFENEAKPIFRNEGNFMFEDQSQMLGVAAKTLPYVAFGVKWLDFNNDGWLDIIMTNGHVADNIADYDSAHSYRQPTLLFANRAGRQFVAISTQAVSDLTRPIVGRGLAVGDIDNDGKIDILLVDSEGSPLLLHNKTASEGHWLRIKLIGTKCNRDGLGAVVTVKTDNATLVRHCHTDGSYLSASEHWIHFGLGASNVVNLTVQWSNGHIDTLSKVKGDQQITIREGK